MNKNWIIAIIVVVVVAFAGWYFVAGQSTKSASQDAMMEKDTMMKEEPSVSPSEGAMMKEDDEGMMEDKDKMMEEDPSTSSGQDKMMDKPVN